MDGARTAASPQIWVPDLRDNLIVAKVGIVRSATVFSCTDHTLKAAGAVVAENSGICGKFDSLTAEVAANAVYGKYDFRTFR